MKVRYIHETTRTTGNILWPFDGPYPMRGGVFPANHPAHRSHGTDHAPLETFRARGYWASCFPEGDGITMKCERGQNENDVVRDIRECFGWEVSSNKGVTVAPTPGGA